MNILYVSYHFVPGIGSTCMMNYNIVKELSKDHNVTVLTLKRNNNVLENREMQEIKSNKNIKIIQVNSGIFHKKNEGGKKILSKKNNKFKRKIKLLFLKKLHSIKDKIMIPDPIIDWIPKANVELKKIMKYGNIDLIVSSSTPYTDHIISYINAKKYQKELILLNGDPWVYEQSRLRGPLRFLVEKKLEKKIIDFSRHMFVVTEKTREQYINNFKLNPQKVTTATLGYDPVKYYNEEHINIFNDKFINVTYGGTLNPIHRNPIPFFHALKNSSQFTKSKVKVRFYVDEVEKYTTIVEEMKLEDIVTINPMISSDEFVDVCLSSNLLLLFGNSSSVQVPGKLYEYIGMNRKILFISNNNDENDASYLIMKKTKNYILSNSEIDIKDFFETINLTDLQNKTFEEPLVEYQWSNTLKPIMDFLETTKADKESYR